MTVEQGGEKASFPLFVNEAIPDGCVLIASGTQGSSLLGSAFGHVVINSETMI